jgi:general secretion pathway protein D
MLDVKRVYVNETLNSITIRETPEKMKLVEKIIAANDLKEAEVILDVEILEISRTNALKYGWNFQPGLSTTATIQPTLSTTTNAVVNANAGVALSELRNLSSDNVFLTLPSLVVNLIKQDSDAQTLANPRVRVLNNKQAKFHIGDKIPVQTATVQATTAVAVTSTFEYKDVGIKLAIEPTVHLNNTVTLKLSMEISTLGDALEFGNGQKQFRFGTRNTDTLINLRDGETVIIGGLIKDEERKTRNKIPLLGDIPVLGKLFSSEDDGTIKTDILMSITPNIVRNMELPDKETQAFWSGTEADFDTKPLFVSAGRSTKPSEKPLDKTAVLESMARREAAAPAGEAAAKQPLGSAPTPTAPAQPPAEGAPVLLEMKPAETAASVGQEMRFEITAGSVKDLYGVILTLSYDPKVVEFKTASEGTLLKKDGQQTSFLFSNNMKAGTVDIYMTRIGDVGGVGGPGSLCTAVFQGKSGGTSDVALKSVKLTNFNREQIKTDTRGAKAVVK